MYSNINVIHMCITCWFMCLTKLVLILTWVLCFMILSLYKPLTTKPNTKCCARITMLFHNYGASNINIRQCCLMGFYFQCWHPYRVRISVYLFSHQSLIYFHFFCVKALHDLLVKFCFSINIFHSFRLSLHGLLYVTASLFCLSL